MSLIATNCCNLERLRFIFRVVLRIISYILIISIISIIPYIGFVSESNQTQKMPSNKSNCFHFSTDQKIDISNKVISYSTIGRWYAHINFWCVKFKYGSLQWLTYLFDSVSTSFDCLWKSTLVPKNIEWFHQNSVRNFSLSNCWVHRVCCHHRIFD